MKGGTMPQKANLTLGTEGYQILKKVPYSKRLEVLYLESPKTHEQSIALRILNKKDFPAFQEKVQKETEIQEFLLKGYKGKMNLPVRKFYKNGYILTPYAGELLDEKVYSSLSPLTQQKVQQVLAEFLNYSHQKSLENKGNLPNVPYREDIGKTPATLLDANINHNLEYVVQAFAPFTSQSLKKHFQSIVQQFNTRDTIDEVSVLVHHDLCPENVLYDKQKKCLSVIDYEHAFVGDIYNDFCHFGGPVWPKGFIEGVIEKYNNLTNASKHPCPISMDKLKLFWEAAILNNQARWVKDWGRKPEDAFKEYLSRRKVLADTKQTKTSKNKGRQ